MNRRNVIAFVGSGLAVAASALGYEAWRLHLFGKRYPPTPFDDLLDLLADRESAKRVGTAFFREHPDFVPADAARALRQRIAHRSLALVLDEEVRRGELTEAGHWLLPPTLTGLCALAAKA